MEKSVQTFALCFILIAPILGITGCNVPIVPVVKEEAPILPTPVEVDRETTSAS